MGGGVCHLVGRTQDLVGRVRHLARGVQHLARETRRLVCGVHDTLAFTPRRVSEAGARGSGLRKCLFNQLVVYQTQRRGKEWCSPRGHSLDMVHQRLGFLPRKVFVEELNLHIHDRFMAERGSSGKLVNGIISLDAYLAANEVKSSCAMFKVESLDLILFNAYSLISSIPSCLTCQNQVR